MLHKQNNIIIEGAEGKPISIDISFIPNKKPKQVLVFCHGFKGFKDWGPFNKIADYFAQENIVFIKFNFSFNGTTPDSPLDFVDLDAFGNNNFSKELDDLSLVLDWIEHTKELKGDIDSSNISLFGHSRGGGISILKTAEDNRIKKVVSWAAPSNFLKPLSKEQASRWEQTGVAYIYNGRTKQNMPMFYQFYTDCMQHAARLDILSACQKITVPLLIVHGSDDPTVPLENAEAIKHKSSNAHLHIIDGANHVLGGFHPFNLDQFPSHLQEAIDVSIEFLKR